MSNELCNPRNNLNGDGSFVDGRRDGTGKMIRIGCPANDDGEENASGDWFEEDVEAAIEYSSYGSR